MSAPAAAPRAAPADGIARSRVDGRLPGVGPADGRLRIAAAIVFVGAELIETLLVPRHHHHGRTRRHRHAAGQDHDGGHRDRQ